MEHFATVVPVRLDDGSLIRIEATMLGGAEKVGGFEAKKLNELLKSVGAVGAALQNELRHLRAEKASVEFGVEIGLESGGLTALICQGTAKANMTISLHWDRGAGLDGRDR